MECLSNTGSFDDARLKIVGFSFQCAPLIMIPVRKFLNIRKNILRKTTSCELKI